MRQIEINGKVIRLAQTRVSKKGQRVDCARVHIPNVGTVYVQVYPNEKAQLPDLPDVQQDDPVVDLLLHLLERKTSGVRVSTPPKPSKKDKHA